MINIKNIQAININRLKYASSSLKRNDISNQQSASYSETVDDGQYLKQSITPTLHFQKSLPRLPIPKIDKTGERYLAALRPISSENEYEKTEALVQAFVKGKGAELDKQLRAINKKNKHTSYISEMWYNLYFDDRRSLLINTNPGLMYQRDPQPAYNEKILRSTNMIISTLRFMNSLNNNILEPEIFHLAPEKSDTEKFYRFVSKLPENISWYGAYFYKAFPLDMSQYCKLFRSTRIPQPKRDKLVQAEKTKNLVVMRKGHVFSFNVIDDEGKIVCGSKIRAMLTYIQGLKLEDSKVPVGALTTYDRDSWSTARQALIDAGNQDILDTINGSIFVLCLDDNTPQGVNQELRSCLHSLDGINRWLDKSFSLIVDDVGDASINFEHSWGDGVALLRYFNDTYADSTQKQVVHPSDKLVSCNKEDVKHLEFKTTPAINEIINKARKSYKGAVDDLGLDHLRFTDFGKDHCKLKGVSPDSVLQLAIQLAYYRQNGETVATYESGSTAAFKHGRTEIVRSCTNETKYACLLFGRDKTDPKSYEQLVDAIKKCSTKHAVLTRQAAMGDGFDRHLFALKHLATEQGDIPELFLDPIYQRMNHYILSTSTLHSEAMRGGCFGPVVQDGYGLAYVVKQNTMETLITAQKKERDISSFKQCLDSSITDIRNVLMS